LTWRKSSSEVLPCKVYEPQETYLDAKTMAIKQGYYLELLYQKQAAALQLLCKSTHTYTIKRIGTMIFLCCNFSKFKMLGIDQTIAVKRIEPYTPIGSYNLCSFHARHR